MFVSLLRASTLKIKKVLTKLNGTVVAVQVRINIKKVLIKLSGTDMAVHIMNE
jgi:hypothetical protein